MIKSSQQGGSFSDVAIEIGILSQGQVKEIKKKYPEHRIYIGMIAESTGIERETVKKVVGGLINTLSQALAAGETVELRGFGKFKSRRYAARTARNPRTGKTVSIPARRVPRLQYARKLRRHVETGTPPPTKR